MIDINYAAGTLDKIIKSGGDFEKNATDFPFSALTQFHLLYHYKNQNDSRTAAQLKLTAIQFPNSLWMRFQIEQALQQAAQERSTIVAEESDVSAFIIDDPIPTDESLSEEKVEEKREEKIEEEGEEEIDIPNIEVKEQSDVSALIIDNPISTDENLSEEEIEEKIEEKPEEINIPNVDVQEQKEVEEFLEEPKMFPKEEPKPETILSESPENEELTLEPLSMRDYFASQGITIPTELLENDKLGLQMKSFTAWLKEMKRLHSNKLPTQNPAIERMIRSSAEKSNSQQEILTETMADILIKQGRPDKAIELYEKLSLMNPSKSTYFAAKIDILKNP